MDITIRYGSDTMGDMDGTDTAATFANYEQEVYDAVRAAFPEAWIDLIGPESYAGHGVTVYSWQDTPVGRLWLEDTDAVDQVLSIISSVFENGSFWVLA